MADDIDQTISAIYFDPGHEGSFGGVNKLYQAVKQYGYSKSQVKEWLSKQDVYTLHKPLNRAFTTPRVVVSAMNQQWDGDTINMVRYKKHNKGYNYILLLIDIFTRFIYTVPLYTLTAKEMKDALQKVFKREKPEKLRTDFGSEFKGQIVQNYISSLGIRHFYATNKPKANFAERCILTLKRKLVHIFQKKRKEIWYNLLDSVTLSYNKSYHRSIKMSPFDARQKKEWYKVWKNQYSYKNPKPKRKNPPPKTNNSFKFKTNDRVRLSRYRSTFERAYDRKWTEEIYTVIQRELNQGIQQYSIKSWKNEPVRGKFYEYELEKVNISSDTLYIIEETLEKETINNVDGYWVKWEGWDKSYNSWIPQTEVVDLV